MFEKNAALSLRVKNKLWLSRRKLISHRGGGSGVCVSGWGVCVGGGEVERRLLWEECGNLPPESRI